MNRSTIIVIVLLLLLGGIGYYWWSGDDSAPGSLTTPYTEEVRMRLAEVDRINSVSLNFSIFDDKFFQALRPLAAGTISLKPGRPNPFLPFTAGQTSSTSVAPRSSGSSQAATVSASSGTTSSGPSFRPPSSQPSEGTSSGDTSSSGDTGFEPE